MEGEDEESDEPRAFTNKKPWQKIIVLAAGSFMNVVCALLIMIISYRRLRIYYHYGRHCRRGQPCGLFEPETGR